MNKINEKQHYREKSDQIRKAENETEEFHVKKIDQSFAKKLVEYRTKNKLTRKALALKLAMKENDIAILETGKAVYDGNLVHRIKMKLHL